MAKPNRPLRALIEPTEWEGWFSWRLVSPNGKDMLRSDTYFTRRYDAERSIRKLLSLIRTGSVVVERVR